MNSRVPESATAGFQGYREEDERRREEARLGTLQGQVDELRQALRELAGRQVRVEENIKGYEGNAAQNRLLIEQIRQEGQQSAQARALDENRTRQQIDDMEQRLDDAIRPIRSLQAHVGELLEVSRRKTDDSGQYMKRIEELRVMIDHVQAIGDRNTVVAHQIRDSVDQVRGETDQIRRDVLHNEDAIKIVDQEIRRRIAEIAQAGETVNSRLDDLRSDIGHAIDLIDETQRSIVHVDPALDELRAIDVDIRQELTRVHQQAVERHEVTVDRLDDLRLSADAQVAEIRTALDQRVERLGERIDEINEVYRDLGVRLSALAHQLDELRLVDEGVRREVWNLHEQRVRLRLEQAQDELDQVAALKRQSGRAVQAGPENEDSPVKMETPPRPADR